MWLVGILDRFDKTCSRDWQALSEPLYDIEEFGRTFRDNKIYSSNTSL